MCIYSRVHICWNKLSTTQAKSVYMHRSTLLSEEHWTGHEKGKMIVMFDDIKQVNMPAYLLRGTSYSHF